MRPILYQANETDYNHRGLGALNEVLEYKVTEELNGEFELFLEYPVAGRLYKEIKSNRLIKAKPNRKDDPHVFRIYEHEVDIETQTALIYARSNVYDLAGNMVPELTVRDHTPVQAWNRIKVEALEPIDFNFYSNINATSSFTWENRNPLSCIVGEEESMLQHWGGELKYGNKWVWLYRRRGNDNVTTIRYGKNLDGLKATYSTKGLVTAILPYTTVRDEENDKEVKVVGTVVKSQYINNYPYTYYKSVEYTEEDGVTNLSSLNDKASKYFVENKDVDLPSIQMEVNLIDLSHTKQYAKFKDLENVEIGDTITVYAKEFDVNITAKVNKVVYNGLTEENEELEVGASRASIYEDYRDLTDDRFNKNIKPYNDRLNIVQTAANGKNRIFRGPKEPTDGLIEGDLWYRPVGDGDMELYIHDGVSWGDPVVTTGINQQIQAELDQADADIQTVKEGAEQAQADADAILEGLGVSELSSGHAAIVGEIKNNVENKITTLDGYYTDVKALADGHQTTLAKLGTEPGDVILDYHRITERTNLYERVLGSDEEGVGGSVARIVASSEIIQQEVRTTAEQVVSGKLSDNLAPDDGSGILTRLESGKIGYFDLIEDLVPGKAYYVKIQAIASAEDLKLHRMGEDNKSFSTTSENNRYEIRFTYQNYGDALNEVRLTNHGDSHVDVALKEVYMIDPDSLSATLGETIRTVETQLANSWSVKNLNSAGDIVGQINLTDGNALIQGRNIILDGNTTVAGTFRVTNTMVASGISATKITTGTLNAANVNVINIDANNIVANATNFVVSAWNGYAGGNVSITGDGIISTASDGSQTYIQNGVTGMRNPDGATIGQIGYIDTGTIATYSLRTSWGSHFELRQRSDAYTEYTMLRAENGATNFFINARERIYLNTSNAGGRVNIDSQLRITSSDEFRMTGGNIVNPYGIYFENGGSIYTLSGDNRITRFEVKSAGIMQFRVGTTQKFRIDSTRNYMNQTLNMTGNAITDSPSVSDARLKDIQRHRLDNDLEKLMNIEYVDFVWKEDGKVDFGFIAQQIQGFAPEIIRDVNGGWLGYDEASYTHLIGHALQQHVNETHERFNRIQQENATLHEKIIELEGRLLDAV